MKRYLILTLLTSSLVLLPKKLLNACGFMVSPGEYRFWLLQPDLTNEQELTPFFFAATYLYKQDPDAAKQAYMQKNIEEWYKEIHKKDVSRGDIDSLLNHTSPDIFFEKRDSLAGVNSFMRYLLSEKDQYDYIKLSKKVEAIAANPDPWDEGLVPKANITEVIQEGNVLYQQAGSSFIKMRTAFQLMRLYDHNGEWDKLMNVYDAHIAPVVSNSWIKSAALYLKAIRLYDPQSNLLLARVFDKGDYNRSYCLIHLRIAEVDSLLGTMPDIHERTVLRAMKVFNSPGRSLSAIEKIVAAEPGYKEIPFLLLREINKVEDWLLTNKFTAFTPAVYDDRKANLLADKAYAIELNRFIQRIMYTQPPLLHLYSAHLSMLTGDYAAAGEQLQAINTRKLPANVKTQIKINRFLLSLETGSMNPSTEKVFLGLLQEPAGKSGIYDADIMKDQLILYTARKMISKGDKARGLMLLSRTRRALGMLPIGYYKDVYQEANEIAEPVDYDKMIAVIGRKHKTAFEEFIATGNFGSPANYYWHSDNAEDNLVWDTMRLLDRKSSWYIRNNDIAAAEKTLRTVPDSFWQQEPYKYYIGGNPFYLDVYRTGKYYGNIKTNYNKKTILSKMLALQRLAANDPSKRAESYFQLANVWYNMSWYGNNWLMVKPWWSSVERVNYDNEMKRTPFNNFYYGCNSARDLYIKAMRATKDPKLAILCCFMAGKCEEHQKEYLWNTRYPIIEGERKQFIPDKNPYLHDLHQKGIDEHFYNEMIVECAVYADYIRGFDKVM